MTGLDANGYAPLCAAGMVAHFDASPDDLAARQVRLAQAMFETFFRQLKLINAVMTELPFGWLRAEAEQASEPTGVVAEADVAALAEVLATQVAAAELVEIRATEVADTKILPASRKPRKSQTSRKKPVTTPKL